MTKPQTYQATKDRPAIPFYQDLMDDLRDATSACFDTLEECAVKFPKTQKAEVYLTLKRR